MIFSASAVTAEQQYGHAYIFVLRQTLWLVAGLLGMFALMRLDYHRLREPAVVYTALCLVLLMLAGTFFLADVFHGQVACDAPLDPDWPSGHSAFGARKTRCHSVSGVVS